MKSTQKLYATSIRTAPFAPLHWPLQMMLSELGFDWKERLVLPQAIAEIFRSEADESVAARKIWDLLGPKEGRVREKIAGRSSQIASQVLPCLDGESVLDFGCGNGRVGAIIASSGFHVVSYDVADYRDPELRSGAFDGDWFRRKNGFDAALVVTVLHHCDEPSVELNRLRNVARRLVVIESVVNANLSFASQAVIDWLYNRGMHPRASIPVPGRFKTVEDWRATFAKHGWRVVHEDDLGIDLPVVPEHHRLFVCERA